MTIVGARVTSPAVLTAADVAAAAQLACLLEASAPKPGNVSPGRHFHDLRYEDFLASAAAIGGPLAGAGARPGCRGRADDDTARSDATRSRPGRDRAGVRHSVRGHLRNRRTRAQPGAPRGALLG